MIGRRKRDKERTRRRVDLDRADVDVDVTLHNLEDAVRKYDIVREQFLRLVSPAGR